MSLIKSWDEATIKTSNGVRAFAFEKPGPRSERVVAVWSLLPYSQEFNNRVCSIKIEKMTDWGIGAIAVDVVTGRSYDVRARRDGEGVVIDKLYMNSDAFVNWVNNTLDIRRTANVLWNGSDGFDFRVFGSPDSLVTPS